MSKLLADHIFSDVLRYENHQLIYAPSNEEPVEMGGILAASLLAVLLIDTDEGEARGITLDTDDQRKDFFARYDREVLRDDLGYLSAEINQLRDNYVQLALGTTTLNNLCPNIRLLNLAMDGMVAYMRQLVIKTFKEHIWEALPWQAPFPQWLLDAARVETRRQRFLQTDWTDAPIVTALADMPDKTEEPTFFFIGEKASDIMERYLHWLSDTYVAVKEELPGAKITSADRKYIFSQETDWAFLSDGIEDFSTSQHKEWLQWQQEWTRFLTERLLPQKEIRFWADDVPEEIQNHLLYHLQLAEQHPAHFRDVTTAVYAMRQLGYIRRKCADKDIRQWLSEHLKLDYTERNNASQFRRAMNEHGRHTPEIREEVQALEAMGYFHFHSPEDPDKSA